MSYEDASPGIERRRRKRCLLLGVAVVLLTVTVLAVVLGLTLEAAKNPEEELKSTVVGRCETYLKEHSDISSVNNCERIWDTFHQAYVGKDPCDVPPEAYDPLIKSITQHVACSRMLFWSRTKDMVHAFTDKRECLFTVEDTLLGFLFDELTWCSKIDSKETFTTDCPGWGDCENNTVRSFWIRASLNFAVTACGNVSAMLNGSLESPFSTTSVFGSVEVKNLDPDKVDSLTVLLVAKETDPSTCESPSFQDLKSTLNPNIAYNCRQVPYNRVEGCISDPEIPCVDCL
ncbi:ADP-ribosyl cyclase/cyclic ADP-ribose hydrolase 1-like [Astyanax mexicanus]|uniref:ADP-ribosyl cyclase/cyclic ADP-ribose hydrolase n=1 Tax=Astyanax mexicanus TaxID=7994 RepID=A0A8B9RFD2_ASTMX|nr:ADP-ribosyl cyclase/cyclic ADP-ribose hydrolase 1-like [Astyanax mexicanus]